MQRLKILMSAYSCEPHKGSESGIGWSIASGMALHHDVWVLTRAQNRRLVEPFLEENPVPGLTVVYHDAPFVPRGWDGEDSRAQLHYPLWQLSLLGAARRLHRKIGFDLAQHVTWGRYWAPSLLSLLRIPFVWGPVGGGESAPAAFRKTLSLRGRLVEWCRDSVRWLGEHDPFVRMTAKRAGIALATTRETEARLKAIGVRNVRVVGDAALGMKETDELSAVAAPPRGAIRFVSSGRLLHWKGFDLGIRAFAKASIPNSQYWILGDGPERARLEQLAANLGVAVQVKFLGHLPRTQAWARFAESHVLVHPSLHDSGGWACIEAMIAGRPVLCLDLGGPATFVDEQSGFRVPATNPEQAVTDLASHMRQLDADRAELARIGQAARASARARLTRDARVHEILGVYNSLLSA